MNKIYLNNEEVLNYVELKQFRLTINGDDNELFLNNFEGDAIIYISIDGNNNRFKIGTNNIIKNDLSINFWNVADREVNGSNVEIGNNNFFNGSNIVIISPLNTTLKIGNGNLIAGNITFWARNDHVIYDIKSRKRLNYDRNIIIGNENWIGQNATFLPGAEIMNNTVIGYGTLVNKKIRKNNVLIAGVPAKIKRKNINWSRASNENNIDFQNNLNINN